MPSQQDQSDADSRQLLARLDALSKRPVTSSVREKIDKAKAIYEEFRQGRVRAEDLRAALRKINQDPEITELQSRH